MRCAVAPLPGSNVSDPSGSQSIEDSIEAIDDALAEGELDTARQRAEKALETHGFDPDLVLLRAEVALETDNYDECVRLVGDALDEVDDEVIRAELLGLAGYAHYYADEVDEARQTFNRAVESDPQAWEAIVGRATVHDYLEFYNAAMIDLERAIELDDQEEQPFLIRGSIYLRFGDYDEAKRDFAYVLEPDPWNDQARLHLPPRQALARQSGDARETLEPLLDEEDVLDEYVMPAALLRSQLSLGLGSTDAAVEDAERAIELAPDQPWGYLQKAACFVTAARPGDAIEALKEAESQMENAADYPDLHGLRASAYEQLEKADKAAAAREKAEGASRLPGVVYGDLLDPARDVPVNPDQPVDIREILREIFGDPDAAPEGYEETIRDVLDQIPRQIEANPDASQLEIELPPAEGMPESPGNLVIQVDQGS